MKEREIYQSGMAEDINPIVIETIKVTIKSVSPVRSEITLAMTKDALKEAMTALTSKKGVNRGVVINALIEHYKMSRASVYRLLSFDNEGKPYTCTSGYHTKDVQADLSVINCYQPLTGEYLLALATRCFWKLNRKFTFNLREEWQDDLIQDAVLHCIEVSGKLANLPFEEQTKLISLKMRDEMTRQLARTYGEEWFNGKQYGEVLESDLAGYIDSEGNTEPFLNTVCADMAFQPEIAFLCKRDEMEDIRA